MLSVVHSFAIINYETVSLPYAAGYTTPVAEYYKTNSLLKNESYYWYDACDDNTVTYFTDANGNIVNTGGTPYHYSMLYAGGHIMSNYAYVASGETVTFPHSLFTQTYMGIAPYYTFNGLFMRLKNGNTAYYFNASGSLSARKIANSK